MAAPAGLLVLGRRPAGTCNFCGGSGLFGKASCRRSPGPNYVKFAGGTLASRGPTLRRPRCGLRKIGGLTTEAKPSRGIRPAGAVQRAASRRWFEASFEGPTPAQAGGWEAISGGDNALICAPTGSGKTLASFLWGIDKLSRSRELGTGVRLVYVSPLKALSYDIERNLRAPLRGIGADISVGLRTGDTPQSERRAMAKTPPDILITTPESLYLMLSSGVREILATTEAVIVDEIHAVAQSKRGSHLALTLERLDHLVSPGRRGEGEDCEQQREVADPLTHASRSSGIQRIGLSATQRPLERIAQFLVGSEAGVQDRRRRARQGARPRDRRPGRGHGRPRGRPPTQLRGRTARRGKSSRWPTSARSGRRSTRSCWSWSRNTPRRSSSSTTAAPPSASPSASTSSPTAKATRSSRPPSTAGRRLRHADRSSPHVEIARAHHGSLSHEERTLVEEMLKSGQLPCLVATSSLELGIDMGAVDLVIQVESPKSVTRGLQRIGRAGHGLGEVSKGRIFPKYRGDLLECAVVARRMREGEIEETVIPQNPLDVLAQHLVSMAALDEWEVDEVERLVTATEPFHDLSREQLENVLDMLDGRYPSDRFAELRPRIVWDRIEGTIHGRKGARQLVVTNAGTIPDRGLYGVHLPDGRRVGELDEEMVYEARPGPDLPARRHHLADRGNHPRPGDRHARPRRPGRGAVLEGRRDRPPGRAGQGDRRLRPRGGLPRARPSWPSEYDLDRARRQQPRRLPARAAGTRPASSPPTRRSWSSASATRSATGGSASSPLTAAASTPPGASRSPAKIRDERDLEADAIWSDDGIVIHLPDADEPPPADLVLVEPDELEDLVVGELSGSALFGARFRENAARSLLIPRAYPGKRTPLWQQRLKAQSLLEVARDFPRFPVILETYRECLQDVLDLPVADRPAGQAARRAQLSLVEVETPTASPFASSLLFDYVATYMYEGDTPNAERRAAALALDRDLLRELLGQEELRELIDPEALEEVEAQLQHRTEAGRAGDRDALQQMLRNIGDLTAEECAERVQEGYSAASMLEKLVGERRVAKVRIAGEERYIAAEDAGLYRDALGVPPPAGLPETFLEDHPDAMRALVRRYARTHGPFPTARLAARYGVDPDPGAARAGGRRGAGPRRAAAGRHRARVVRLRSAAPGAPRQPRPPAPRGRGGRPHPARPLPAELAERRRLSAPPAPVPTACARRWCRCRASR